MYFLQQSLPQCFDNIYSALSRTDTRSKTFAVMALWTLVRWKANLGSEEVNEGILGYKKKIEHRVNNVLLFIKCFHHDFSYTLLFAC